VRCIGFSIAAGLPPLALAPGTLAEVLLDYVECRLPGAPASLHRLVALRGALLPVFDPRIWLGLAPATRTRILAIGRGERAAAIVVDGEPAMLELADAAHDVPSPAALGAYLRPARDASGNPAWWFDHEAWFAVAARAPDSRNDWAHAAAEVNP
jgi:chemotaxis signal transduction protein